jgi:hypothetical protein
MKTIIKINFSNYSENEIVLNANCLVSLKEEMNKDSDFISFEIIQEGDDIELVKRILFTDRTILKIEVTSSDKKRVSTGSYYKSNGQKVNEWKQVLSIRFKAFICYQGDIIEKLMSAQCRFTSDIESACFETVSEFLNENKISLKR